MRRSDDFRNVEINNLLRDSVRICILCSGHSDEVVAGSEVQATLLSRYWAAAGNAVLYIAMNDIDRSKRCVATLGRDAVRLVGFDRSISPLKRLLLTKYLLEAFCPDVIYYRNYRGLVAFALLAKYLGIPLVFHVSHENEQTPIKKVICRRRYLFPLKFLVENAVQPFKFMGLYLATEVIVLNNTFQRNLRHFGIRSHVYMDLLPEAETVPDPEIVASPFVVWVANIKSAKQPEVFIRLAAECCTGTYFVMIGAIQEDRYKRMIEAATVDNPKLLYVGPKSLKLTSHWIQQSLFLVHTCLPEGFGDNFILAWYHGKPTITYSFDPDDIIAGNCIGYHSRTFAQLKHDVSSLIQDEALRKAMGGRAAKFARMNFQQDVLAREVLECLRGACAT